MEKQQMFWGLIVKPEKRYEQTVQASFHVSMACVEPNSLKDGVTSLYLEVDNEDYLIGNLNKGNLNVTMDLNFTEGEDICFKTEGSGVVHLSGYLVPEEDEPPSMYDMMEEAEEEEEEEESEEESVPQLTNGKKRKNEENGGKATNEIQVKKKKKGEDADKQEAVKKAKDVQKKIAEEKKKVTQKDRDEASDDEDSEDDDGEEEEEEDDDGEEEEEEEDSDEEMESPVKSSPKEKSPKEKSPKKKDNQNGDAKSPQTPKEKNKNEQKAKSPGKKNVLKGGVVVVDSVVGNGAEAKRGKMIGMYYDGKLKSNGKRFDKNMSGKPFKFRLGGGEVIKGWDIGLEGMKVGGKRTLTIPANMAYGARGAPPDIPPNATLVFDVECKFVN